MPLNPIHLGRARTEGEKEVALRSPKIPNYHERIVLEAIRHGRPVPDRPKTIETNSKKVGLNVTPTDIEPRRPASMR